MKNLRRRFDRFCFANRDKGIPNLMLYVVLGTALVYVMNMIDQSYTLYYILCFNREAILAGQIWRLITFPLTYMTNGLLSMVIGLFCYYSLGRAMENIWGTLRFNLFYFTGVILMDIYCMIFGGQANAYYLNMGLFLAYATLYPNAHFLLFYIIPIRAWVFALLDLVLIFLGVFFGSFPTNLFPVVALANYFLFFGKDVLNVIPTSWRTNSKRLFRKVSKKPSAKPIPFPTAGSYEATHTTVKAPYNHRCSVCGRTDISDPHLEFRYCSRCNGYYCYCEEHISNHVHIQ